MCLNGCFHGCLGGSDLSFPPPISIPPLITSLYQISCLPPPPFLVRSEPEYIVATFIPRHTINERFAIFSLLTSRLKGRLDENREFFLYSSRPCLPTPPSLLTLPTLTYQSALIPPSYHFTTSLHYLLGITFIFNP